MPLRRIQKRTPLVLRDIPSSSRMRFAMRAGVSNGLLDRTSTILATAAAVAFLAERCLHSIGLLRTHRWIVDLDVPNRCAVFRSDRRFMYDRTHISLASSEYMGMVQV
jgi:hypothetical protein